jgi:hypothetical protein
MDHLGLRSVAQPLRKAKPSHYAFSEAQVRVIRYTKRQLQNVLPVPDF